MTLVRQAFIGVIVFLLAACHTTPAVRSPRAGLPAGPPEQSTAAARRGVDTGRDAHDSRSTTASIAVTLRPAIEGRLGVGVEIVAAGDATLLRAWSRTSGAADELGELVVRDEAGVIATRRDANRVELDRAPQGAVHVSYRCFVPSGRAAANTLSVFSDHFVGAGETLLLLPDEYDDRPVSLSVAIDGSTLKLARAASSLGVGSTRAGQRIGRFLRRSTFMGGALGTAVFEAPEGHDEGAWLGATAFDPRPVIGELAQVRTGFGDFFRDRDAEPMTYLIIGESRREGEFTSSARAGSVLVQVGAHDPWTAPLRVAVAQQMLHAWIGGALWIGPTDREHEAESAWFIDGVARYLARRLLRKFGVLDSNEVRDEITVQIAEQATSKYRLESTARVASRVPDKAARALLAARGALYATLVDAEIRAASGGRRSLDEVIIALYRRALDKRKALPAADWVEALTLDLGSRGAAEYKRYIEMGEAIVLPDDALGACFRPARATYSRFELGYDERATRDSIKRTVVGLDPAGPAFRAGVREGDIIDAAEYRAGRTDMPVRLTVLRRGNALSLSYLPRDAERAAQGFTRVRDVPEERCDH